MQRARRAAAGDTLTAILDPGGVDHARHTAELELAGAGILVVIITSADIFFTPETSGASDAGAATINAVLVNSILTPIALALALAAAVAVLLAEHIIQATEDSAAHAPHIAPTDADTQSLQKALESQLAASAHAYHPAPKTLPAFPDARRADRKTPVQGGRRLRMRWKDGTGKIYEWNSQHGAVEK